VEAALAGHRWCAEGEGGREVTRGLRRTERPAMGHSDRVAVESATRSSVCRSCVRKHLGNLNYAVNVDKSCAISHMVSYYSLRFKI
jgi:hypothetical protein